jgi:hypothetical protein
MKSYTVCYHRAGNHLSYWEVTLDRSCIRERFTDRAGFERFCRMLDRLGFVFRQYSERFLSH